MTTQDDVSYSEIDVHELCSLLDTDLQRGLSQNDAQQRLLRDGLNELELGQKESLLFKFLEQFKDPLILLLLGSALISILIGNIQDAVSIAVVRIHYMN